MVVEHIRLEDIDADESTQARIETCQKTVQDYAYAIDELPPILLFRGKDQHLRIGDGWHRFKAHALAKRETIRAHVLEGSKQEAFVFSIKANRDHGLRFTNADKRRAISVILEDPAFADWSDNRIAKETGLSQPFVGKIRATYNGFKSTKKRTGTDGREIDVSNIGKNRAARSLSSDDSQLTTLAIAAPGRSVVNDVEVDDPPDIVKLRAEGRIPAGVVPVVTEPEPGAVGDTVESIREKHEERRAIQEELPDDEWLKALPLASELTGAQLGIFQRDALDYRNTERERKTYKRSLAIRFNKNRRPGPWLWRQRFAISMRPPSEWIRCPAPEHDGCGGTGQVPLVGQCPKCHGAGYWIPN